MPITFNHGAPSQYMELARDRQNLLLRKRAMDEQALARQQQASQAQASMMGNMLVQPMWQMALQQHEVALRPQIMRDQAAIGQGFRDWKALEQAAAADPMAQGDVNQFLSLRNAQAAQYETEARNFLPFGATQQIMAALGELPYGGQSQFWSQPFPDDDAALLRDPPPQFREEVQRLFDDEARLSDEAGVDADELRARLADQRYSLVQRIRQHRAQAPRLTPEEELQQKVLPLEALYGPRFQGVVAARNRYGGFDIREVGRSNRGQPTWSPEQLASLPKEQYEFLRLGQQRDAELSFQTVVQPDGTSVLAYRDSNGWKPVPASALSGGSGGGSASTGVRLPTPEALYNAAYKAAQERIRAASRLTGEEVLDPIPNEQQIRDEMQRQVEGIRMAQLALQPLTGSPAPGVGEQAPAESAAAGAPAGAAQLPAVPPPAAGTVIDIMTGPATGAAARRFREAFFMLPPNQRVERATAILDELKAKYDRVPISEWAEEDQVRAVCVYEYLHNPSGN